MQRTPELLCVKTQAVEKELEWQWVHFSLYTIALEHKVVQCAGVDLQTLVI